MRAKDTEELFEVGSTGGFRAVKRFLLALILVAAFGNTEAFSSEEFPSRPYQSDLNPSISHSHSLNGLTCRNYVLTEDDELTAEVFKRFSDTLSLLGPKTSVLPGLNLNFETLINSINAFHRVSTLSFSRLRSPPLFS